MKKIQNFSKKFQRKGKKKLLKNNKMKETSENYLTNFEIMQQII